MPGAVEARGLVPTGWAAASASGADRRAAGRASASPHARGGSLHRRRRCGTRGPGPARPRGSEVESIGAAEGLSPGDGGLCWKEPGKGRRAAPTSPTCASVVGPRAFRDGEPILMLNAGVFCDHVVLPPPNPHGRAGRSRRRSWDARSQPVSAPRSDGRRGRGKAWPCSGRVVSAQRGCRRAHGRRLHRSRSIPASGGAGPHVSAARTHARRGVDRAG